MPSPRRWLAFGSARRRAPRRPTSGCWRRWWLRLRTELVRVNPQLNDIAVPVGSDSPGAALRGQPTRPLRLPCNRHRRGRLLPSGRQPPRRERLRHGRQRRVHGRHAVPPSWQILRPEVAPLRRPVRNRADSPRASAGEFVRPAARELALRQSASNDVQPSFGVASNGWTAEVS